MAAWQYFIAKTFFIDIIYASLERRLMVGQEILVLFIMVRIRALQPKIQPPLAGGLIFVRARIGASAKHAAPIRR